MLVETGEEITTKISSREEKGVAGQGSLRAGRITNWSWKNKAHSTSGMVEPEKTTQGPLFYRWNESSSTGNDLSIVSQPKRGKERQR